MVTAELSAIAVFGLVVLFGWSPLLAVERIRSLFSWPTRWLAVNYIALGAAVVSVQCLSYLAVVLVVAGTGSVTGGEAAGIVAGIGLTNLLIPGLGAVSAVQFLPSRGVWTPDGEGLDGRIALGFGVIWYSIITTATFVVIGLALMFANLPT